MSKTIGPLAAVLVFPDRWNSPLDQKPEQGTTRLMRSNHQLVQTLKRLSDSYRALLAGEPTMDAEEILAEVSNALLAAARAGNM
jgi:hypothetical protein